MLLKMLRRELGSKLPPPFFFFLLMRWKVFVQVFFRYLVKFSRFCRWTQIWLCEVYASKCFSSCIFIFFILFKNMCLNSSVIAVNLIFFLIAHIFVLNVAYCPLYSACFNYWSIGQLLTFSGQALRNEECDDIGRSLIWTKY